MNNNCFVEYWRSYTYGNVKLGKYEVFQFCGGSLVFGTGEGCFAHRAADIRAEGERSSGRGVRGRVGDGILGHTLI